MAELIECTSRYKASNRDKKYQVTERCVLRCNSVGIFTAVPAYMSKYDSDLDEQVKFQLAQPGDVILKHSYLVLNEKISNVVTTWKYTTTVPGVYIPFNPSKNFIDEVIAKDLWNEEGFVWENIPDAEVQAHFINTWTSSNIHDVNVQHAVGMIKEIGSSFNVIGCRVLPASISSVRNLYKVSIQHYIQQLAQKREQDNIKVFILEDGKVQQYSLDTFLSLTDVESGVKEIVVLRRFAYEGNDFIQSMVIKVEAKR